MWRQDEAYRGVSASSSGSADAPWIAIGPDTAMLAEQAAMLACFGVNAQPADASIMPPPGRPVLCDRRSQGVMRRLLDRAASRSAPVVVFGVAAPQARARLILAGADDAVSARIAPCELASRMIAARRSRAAAQGIVNLAGLTFDMGLRQARWQGEIVPLMPREFDLLLVLARHSGFAVSRDLLLREVWRTAFDPGTNSPEVHIFKLRQRLAALGGAVRVETVKGQGYRLVTSGLS